MDGSLRGIADLIGPGLFTLTFAYCIAPGRAWTLPGAPFLLAALLQVAAIALACRALRSRGGPETVPKPQNVRSASRKGL